MSSEGYSVSKVFGMNCFLVAVIMSYEALLINFMFESWLLRSMNRRYSPPTPGLDFETSIMKKNIENNNLI